MSEFWMLFLDAKDQVCFADVLKASNPETAIRRANRLVGDAAVIEVWQAGSLVARLSAEEAYQIRQAEEDRTASFDAGDQWPLCPNQSSRPDNRHRASLRPQDELEQARVALEDVDQHMLQLAEENHKLAEEITRIQTQIREEQRRREASETRVQQIEIQLPTEVQVKDNLLKQLRWQLGIAIADLAVMRKELSQAKELFQHRPELFG